MTKLPEVGKRYKRKLENYLITISSISKENVYFEADNGCIDFEDINSFFDYFEEEPEKNETKLLGVELNEFHALMDRMHATRLTIDCADGTKFVIIRGGIEISNNKK